MKRIWIIVSAAGLLCVAATHASADTRFSVHGDFNVPVSTNSIGITIEVNRRFAIRAYHRSLYNFSVQAVANGRYGVSATQERVNTLGAGLSLHIF